MSKQVRVRGQLVRGPLLLRSELQAGTEDCVHEGPRSFLIRSQSGKEIRIACVRSTILLSEVTRNDRWSALEHHEAAAPFRARAPAPHLRVQLTYASIANEEVVEVLGTETEQGFEEQVSGPRSEATPRTTAMDATAIAWGPKAQQQLDAYNKQNEPRMPASRGKTLSNMLLASGIGTLLFGALIEAPMRLDLWAWSAFLFACACSHGIRLEGGFAEGKIEVESNSFASVAHWSIVGTALFFGVMLTGVDRAGNLVNGRQVSQPHVMYLLLGGTGLFVTAYSYAKRSAFLRLARIMLSAPPLVSRAPDGTWGAIEGAVRTKSSAVPAMTSLFEEEYREGSSPNDYVWRLESEATFWVHSPDGTSYAVHPRGASFSSAVVERTNLRATPKEPKQVIARQVLRDGGAALVVGRISGADAPSFSASGPESLLVFASPADSSPREKLQNKVRKNWFAVVVPLLLSLGLLLLGIVRPGFGEIVWPATGD